MNKGQLISKAAEVLRQNKVQKIIPPQKFTFYISDEDGNQNSFTVKKNSRAILLNKSDVEVILDALLAVVEDAMKRGEPIELNGYGKLGMRHRVATTTTHPQTGKTVPVPEKYIPKFWSGEKLRKAALIYQQSLKETPAETVFESYFDEDEEACDDD
ncbi:MAG: HU family DNA-binding protein [Oscillospiraceae bacterium]|nr:HU family DNA-binding protein [Candidatus Limimonas egerieequi]